MTRPRLLVLELWGLGDLALATAFLRRATAKYDVTLVAKPFALELRTRLWPEVRVVPLTAPWTARNHKYDLAHWPWRELARLWKQLALPRFDVGVSARWDPRDAAVLAAVGCRRRIGYARRGSRVLLTESPPHPATWWHRHEEWRGIARAVGFELPPRDAVLRDAPPRGGAVLVHVGSSHPVRVWDLERYVHVISRLRQLGHEVMVACDPPQLAALVELGERAAIATATVSDLVGMIDRAAAFVGNDSGPGHVAAACGVPTFTIFGNNVPELFLPTHAAADHIAGKPCPHKPCWDRCHFDRPHCIADVTTEEVWPRVRAFIARHVSERSAS